jgi:hypothetical protein
MTKICTLCEGQVWQFFKIWDFDVERHEKIHTRCDMYVCGEDYLTENGAQL